MSLYSSFIESIRADNEYAHLEQVIQKELFHQDILSYMSDGGYFDKLTFIGGTAIRLCYQGQRLSEDLDFTGGYEFTPESLGSFAGDMKQVLEKKYQLPVEVLPPKQEETNTRTWKIQITTDPEHPHIPKQRIHIDIAGIPSYQRQFMTIQNRYNLPAAAENRLIPVESPREILTDKIIALAFRGGTQNPIKGRDLFDIHVFHQQGISEVIPEFDQKLSDHGRTLTEFDTALDNKLELMRTDPMVKTRFEHEMMRFLPLSLYTQTVAHEQFFEYAVNLVQMRAKAIQASRDPSSWDPGRQYDIER
jgi:predicted nucleotidyltransferase component of viral defense system